MDKRLEPLIRHYIKLDYDVSLESSKAMLIYSNLALDYIEEEIHEGSHGPLPVDHSEKSLKIPDKFGESSLFFKESDTIHYKYDFILLTDLSMLKTSKAGKGLLKQKVLPYHDKHVTPAERKKKLKKGELVDYISHHTASSFGVNLLRALTLSDSYPGKNDSDEVKKKYLNLLIDSLYRKKFLTLSYERNAFYKSPFQAQYDINLHGGYLYDAFERIIQELNSKTKEEIKWQV